MKNFIIPTARAVLLYGCLLLILIPSARTQILDIATNATDPFDLSDTEPSIAVNPLDPLEIAIVTFSEGWSAIQGAPVWKSIDGGNTWTKLPILPRPTPGTNGPGDQKVQFDQNGNLVVAELAFGISPPNRCLIFRQTGLDANPLTPGAFYGDDQPMLDIDINAGSSFLGRSYSAWLDFGLSPERSTVTWSPDLGANVNNVTAGNASDENRTTRSAVGPDGSVYIVFKTREGTIAGGFENAHFRVKRSDNGGGNWNALGANGVSVHGAGQVQTWFTTSWGNPAKGKVARARSSDAWIATDPGDGDVYVVYCDQDASGFGQVFVARSTDRGATWGPSVRVTDGTRHSAFPEIAVTCNGTVGVMYVDFDDSGANTIFRHRFARSFNNGNTWTTENLQSMDPGPINNAADGFLWGDYEGLAAQGGAFYGVFTGQSIGRSTLQLDPIFFKRQSWQTPITITCPANVTVNAAPGLCTANVAFPPPAVVADNCTVQSIVQTTGLPSGSSFPVGTTVNTFTLTDALNTTQSCQFTVNVVDNQLPSITCPANLTQSCEISTNPATTGNPVTSDNCLVATVSFADNITPGSCPGNYTIHRTWTASDNSGNTRSCTQTITIQDITPPVISCPADITVTCNTTPDSTGTATAVDNCDPTPTLQHSDGPPTGDCDWLCTFKRIWIATDNCGNTSSCVQTITKNTLPLIEQALNADVTGDGRPDLLVLGTSNSTLTIPPGRGNCILQWLPSQGTQPTGLKFKKKVVGADCKPGTNPLDENGKLVNPLLAEALKLNIFVRLKPSLGTTKLNTLNCADDIILHYLAPNPDINELLRVTNTALGNVAVQPHLQNLLTALQCINAPLDVCNL